MVIAKILGGLGNQLFQYAMARSVSHRNKTEMKVDLRWFETEQADKKPFFLDRFNVKYSVASETEIKGLIGLRNLLGRDMYEAIIPFKHKKYIRLREFEAFQDKYLTLGGNVYLEGYWTDERYFRDISNILRQEITLKSEPSQDNRQFFERIRKTESVSIHIRRGDYVTNSHFRPIFNICDDRYYGKAISEITRKVWNPSFFIFSDDIEWARQHLNTGHETVYVSRADGKSPYEELVLMSLCRHNIIANSTFSWWGAWLNRNEGKTVIAPGKWFNLPGRQGGECVPSTWSKIEMD